MRFVINYNSSHYGNIKDIDCLLVPTFTEEKGIEYCNLSNLNGSLAYQLEMGWVTSEESFVYYELDRLISGIYPKDTGEIFDRRRERLAALLHEEVWIPWMTHMFSKLTRGIFTDKDIYAELLFINGHDENRWKEMMGKKYEELTDIEKTYDQKIADKLMKLLEEE